MKRKLTSVLIILSLMCSLVCNVCYANSGQEKDLKKLLIENYWESFIQSYEIYKFNENGTGYVFEVEPGLYYDKEALQDCLNNLGELSNDNYVLFNYEIDGNRVTISRSDFELTFEVTYVYKSDNIDWDIGIYDNFPENTGFFYEVNYIEDEWGITNAFYLTNTNIKSGNTYNEITVVLNGEEIKFDQPPVMINDRVMVPIRAIFEAMGYTVNWNGETQTAEAIKLNNNITVQINNNIIRYAVSEKSGIYECDVVPQIISGRTLVPVRAIAESAGCDVQWDGENTTVIITYYENSSNQLEERNAKALLLAGYDDDEDANKKQNHLDANRLSVDFVEEALNYLNITDVEKHYMEDNQKNMSALELVEILQNTFKNATDNDLSIIYYSGHTYTNHTTLFSGISFQNFYNLIKNNIKGTVLLMYDGCFAGELLNLSEYDDRIKIIAACDEDDYSSSYYLAEIDESSDDDRICSIFAYALYNGAINNMNYLDSNNDKTVAFNELYVYLLNSVYNICDRITTQEDKLNRLKDMLGRDTALRIAQIVQAYPNSDTTPLFTIK